MLRKCRHFCSRTVASTKSIAQCTILEECNIGREMLKSSVCSSCPLNMMTSSRKCPLRLSCPIFTNSRRNYSSSATKNSAKCYCCARELEVDLLIKCSECGRLQRIDVTQRVKSEFLNLQRLLHPDQYVGHPEELEKASSWSSLVNVAYQTLRSDTKRAIYLYNLISPVEYNVEGGGGSLSEDELMEILEMREVLESCEDKDEIEDIIRGIETDVDRVKNQISNNFSKRNMDGLKRYIDILRFKETILEAANTRLSTL